MNIQVPILFNDLDEYTKFLNKPRSIAKFSGDDSALISLSIINKEYQIETHHSSKKCIGDTCKAFSVTDAALKIFNDGCTTLIKLLNTIVEEGNLNSIQMDLGAFGQLNYDWVGKVDSNLLLQGEYLSNLRNSPAPIKYSPEIRTAKVVFDKVVDDHNIRLLQNITTEGIVEYQYIMQVFFPKYAHLVYVVSSEKAGPLSFLDEGEFFLCSFTSSSHNNYGASTSWGNIDLFTQRAISMISTYCNLDLSML